MRMPIVRASILAAASVVSGCGGSTTSGSTSSAPSCDDLQKQIDACPGLSQADKDMLEPFCATASDACRSCLDGHLCGVTEQCDPVCGKASDAGGQSD